MTAPRPIPDASPSGAAFDQGLNAVAVGVVDEGGVGPVLGPVARLVTRGPAGPDCRLMEKRRAGRTELLVMHVIQVFADPCISAADDSAVPSPDLAAEPSGTESIRGSRVAGGSVDPRRPVQHGVDVLETQW
jgi:hypothetical protein